LYVLADVIAEHEGDAGAYPSVGTLAAEVGQRRQYLTDVGLPMLRRLGLIYGESRAHLRKPTIFRTSFPQVPRTIPRAPNHRASVAERDAWRDLPMPDVYPSAALLVDGVPGWPTVLPTGPYLVQPTTARRGREEPDIEEEREDDYASPGGSVDNSDYASPGGHVYASPGGHAGTEAGEGTTPPRGVQLGPPGDVNYASPGGREPLTHTEHRGEPPVPIETGAIAPPDPDGRGGFEQALEEPPFDDFEHEPEVVTGPVLDGTGSVSSGVLAAPDVGDEQRDDDGVARAGSASRAVSPTEPLTGHSLMWVARRFLVDGAQVQMLAGQLAERGLDPFDVLTRIPPCIDCKTAAARGDHLSAQVLAWIERHDARTVEMNLRDMADDREEAR
jgi:hypothetical protein